MYNLNELRQHLESHWQVKARAHRWPKGPVEKLDSSFRVLEFPPGPAHALWIYATLGMSLNRPNDLIEVHVFSEKQDEGLIELLTVVASYHRNGLPLGLHHTVNFGVPWQGNATCSFRFISLPYLDGEGLEIFNLKDAHLHNLWLIPITEEERDFKIANGWEALEEAFETSQLDYTHPQRTSCV